MNKSGIVSTANMSYCSICYQLGKAGLPLTSIRTKFCRATNNDKFKRNCQVHLFDECETLEDNLSRMKRITGTTRCTPTSSLETNEFDHESAKFSTASSRNHLFRCQAQKLIIFDQHERSTRAKTTKLPNHTGRGMKKQQRKTNKYECGIMLQRGHVS